MTDLLSEDELAGLKALRELAETLPPYDWQWTTLTGENGPYQSHEDMIEGIAKTIRHSESLGLHAITWNDEDVDGRSSVVCTTGNGPTSPLHAQYIAAVKPSNILRLLSHIDALKAERDGLKGASFQDRVQPWMMACFGAEIAADLLERNDRFIEEALEFVQAGDYPKERAHALVEYVYGRPQGEINQEVGGVMVTLAAACLARGVDMHAEAERELARIWTKVEVIRAKQAAKPRGSALPIEAVDPIATARTSALKEAAEVARLEIIDLSERPNDDPLWISEFVRKHIERAILAIAEVK